MNNMLIAQSGGPTAAINASLSGAIQEAIRSKEIDGVYGALNGIQGVLAGTIIDLRSQFSRQEDFSILECTPAMALGSCRFRLPEEDADIKGGQLPRRTLLHLAMSLLRLHHRAKAPHGGKSLGRQLLVQEMLHLLEKIHQADERHLSHPSGALQAALQHAVWIGIHTDMDRIAGHSFHLLHGVIPF